MATSSTSTPASAVAPLPAKPGRPCGTCAHAARKAIDLAISRGVSYRGIEKLHGISDSNIRRHALVCVPQCLQEAADVRAAANVTTAATVTEEVGQLLDTAKEALTAATADGTHGERAASLRELRQTVELLGRLRGELGADVELRVGASASWGKAKAAILAALGPHPAALADVIAALKAID